MTILTNGETNSPMVKQLIRTVDQLIAAFEGSTALAEWAGVGGTAIANWSARNFVPPGWHLRLYVEALRRDLDLDLEALFGLSPDEVEALRAATARHPPTSRKGDRARLTA